LPAFTRLFIYRKKIGKLYGISGLVNCERNLTVSNNLFSGENGLGKNKNQQNLACPQRPPPTNLLLKLPV
jgi:hypothetical protein